MKAIGYGCSHMAGGGITETTLLRAYHFELTALWRGETYENNGVGGRVAADLGDVIFAHSPVAGERFEIAIGFNDVCAFGAGAAALGVFSSCVSALALWLAGNKSPAVNNDWSFTGAWSNSGITPGKYTDAASATASGTFDGDLFILGYTVSSYLVNGLPFMGRFKVTIDGIDQGIFSAQALSSTQRNIDSSSRASAALRLAGFGAGSHTFTITTLDARRVFIDWIGRGANGLLCSI